MRAAPLTHLPEFCPNCGTKLLSSVMMDYTRPGRDDGTRDVQYHFMFCPTDCGHRERYGPDGVADPCIGPT